MEHFAWITEWKLWKQPNLNQSQDQKVVHIPESKCVCESLFGHFGISDELSLVLIKIYLVIGYYAKKSVFLFCDMIQTSHLIYEKKTTISASCFFFSFFEILNVFVK